MFNRHCLRVDIWIFGLFAEGLAQVILYERQVGSDNCSKISCFPGDQDRCCLTSSENSSTFTPAETIAKSSDSLETGYGFSSQTSILSIVSTPLATPVTSIQAVPSSTAAPASTSRAALSVSTPIYHGLTSDEKLGIGIGVGVGVPIILGIIAALYFLSKRRPSRQSDGPYGPVMRNDKGADERASYSSPRMLPQEMQNLSPAAPFLPTPAQTDAMAYHGKDSEYHEAELAMLSTLAARDVPVCLQQHTEGLYYNNTSAARPMTSREMYNLTSANIDMVRPATAPGSRCLSKIAHDEPPSPVSPVSPISSAGSRPPSLMQNDYQHDL